MHLSIICAYLLGSIPSGLWIGKTFYKTDIREHGSRNLGATNTFRVLGKKPGVYRNYLDILKGTAAVLLPLLPYFRDTYGSSSYYRSYCSFSVICYPIFAGFRGGKAVATSAGVLLGYAWPLFVFLVIVFLISLKLTKMVSLTSMIASTVALIYATVNLFITGE